MRTHAFTQWETLHDNVVFAALINAVLTSLSERAPRAGMHGIQDHARQQRGGLSEFGASVDLDLQIEAHRVCSLTSAEALRQVRQAVLAQ